MEHPLKQQEQRKKRARKAPRIGPLISQESVKKLNYHLRTYLELHAESITLEDYFTSQIENIERLFDMGTPIGDIVEMFEVCDVNVTEKDILKAHERSKTANTLYTLHTYLQEIKNGERYDVQASMPRVNLKKKVLQSQGEDRQLQKNTLSDPEVI